MYSLKGITAYCDYEELYYLLQAMFMYVHIPSIFFYDLLHTFTVFKILSYSVVIWCMYVLWYCGLYNVCSVNIKSTYNTWTSCNKKVYYMTKFICTYIVLTVQYIHTWLDDCMLFCTGRNSEVNKLLATASWASGDENWLSKLGTGGVGSNPPPPAPDPGAKPPSHGFRAGRCCWWRGSIPILRGFLDISEN
jgi:hypothetical protein